MILRQRQQQRICDNNIAINMFARAAINIFVKTAMSIFQIQLNMQSNCTFQAALSLGLLVNKRSNGQIAQIRVIGQ